MKMLKLITFVIVFITIKPWSLDEQKDQMFHINMKSADYSKLPKITSNLPRAEETALIMQFNWNDIYFELDKLTEQFPPKVNVGGSIPDYLPSQVFLDALAKVAANQSDPNSYKLHQYSRSTGDMRLVTVVAKFYSYLLKRNLNARKEILITAGAINALDLAARAFTNPGDEVIIFEPFLWCFRAIIAVSGGKLMPVQLRVINGTGENSNDWSFDKKELESKINRKTKWILLNNPNNPIGKAFTWDELIFIGYLAKKYNLLIISDESAQWYQYDNPGHNRIASIPGLFERIITITSGGKIFSNTGWRIGWAIGPEDKLWAMSSLIGSSIISVSTPMQTAYAIGLETELKRWGDPDSYFNQLRQIAKTALDRIVSILKSVGAEVIIPTAGYSVTANFSKLADQIDLSSQNDYRPGMKFMKYMLIEKGIATWPLSIFYSEKNLWKTEYCLRFTNLKTLETYDTFERLLLLVFKRVNTVQGTQL